MKKEVEGLNIKPYFTIDGEFVSKMHQTNQFMKQCNITSEQGCDIYDR